MFFLTNPHCMFPQLRPKGFLYEKDRFESLYIHLAEQALESPPHSLPGHLKCFVDFFAVCPLKNHVAWSARLQLYPEIIRIH